VFSQGFNIWLLCLEIWINLNNCCTAFLVLGVFEREHDGVRDVGQGEEGSFDFARVDGDSPEMKD